MQRAIRSPNKYVHNEESKELVERYSIRFSSGIYGMAVVLLDINRYFLSAEESVGVTDNTMNFWYIYLSWQSVQVMENPFVSQSYQGLWDANFHIGQSLLNHSIN